MKTPSLFQPHSFLAATLAVLAAFLTLFAAPSAQAAARTWSGGNGDWLTGSQGGWSTGPWTAGDTGTFNGPGGTVTVKSAITTGSGAALGFAAGNYTLQSDDTTERVITLGNANVTIGSGVTTTIGSKVTLSQAALIFDGNSTATSTLNINSGGKAINVTSGLTIKETTANVNSGGNITVPTSLVVGSTADGATLNVLGGTVDVGTLVGDTTANIILGNTTAAATANLKITAGSLGFATAGTEHGIRVGNVGSSGTITATIDLEGGIVTVCRIYERIAAHSSTINLHGGTLKALINHTDFLVVDNVWVKSGGAIFDSNGKTITVTKALATDTVSTGGGLTLNDTAANKGSLTLSATPTYTGPTIVTAGKLVVPSTHAGTGPLSALTVSANATLGVTVLGTSQWLPASVSLGNPCTLEFSSVQNPGSTTAPIQPGSLVVAVAGVTVNINSISGTVVAGNSYPLLGQVTATTGYTLGTQPVGVTGHLAVSGGSTLAYVVDSYSDLWTGANVNPTWWDIGTTVNWAGKALGNSPVGSYADGDSVLFGDTATPATPVTVGIQTSVAPGNMFFANSTKNYIVTNSGTFAIGGSGSLTKSGSGTLTLSGTNGYSGGTTLSGGILTAATNNALGTGAVAINPGATRLVVNDGVTLTNNLTINGGGASSRGVIENSGSGNATLSGGTITINAPTAAGGHFASTGGGTLTVASVITANTPIVTQRTGKVIYSGGGTGYTNLISGGTIQVGFTDGIATTATVGLGEAATPGILDLNGFNQSLVGITKGANSATITNSSTTTPATLTLTGSTTTNFVGMIKDDGGLGKVNLTVNGGNVTLSGVNTYSGATLVNAGELIGKTAGSCANSVVTVASGATNGVQLAAANGQWTCGGLTYSAGTTYVDFDFTATAPSTTVAPLQISGNLVVNSTVNVIARSGGAPTAGISYPLITWTGSGPADLNGFGTVTLPSSMPGTLSLDIGTKTISVMAGIKVPNLAYANAWGLGRKIALADIQAAGLASSQGSPTYTITLPSGTSAQGGSVTTDGSLIFYEPAGTPAGDSFSYTVSDGTAAATATVTITFGSVAGAQIDPALIGNDGADHARFTLRGIPNTSYHVQRATVLEPTPNWTNADAGVTTGADGSYLWTDTVTITSLGDTVFYRISYP